MYYDRFDVAPGHLTGIELFDFIRLDNFFELNLITYELDCKVNLSSVHKETIRLNVYENPLSIIVNFDQYCGVYQCIHCAKLWYRNCDYFRHQKLYHHGA